MKRQSATLVALMLLYILQSSEVNCQFTRKENVFIDNKTGRANVFHGVNAIFKTTPFLPITDKFDPFNGLNEDDIPYFQKWGFNFIRLGLLWEAHETGPDQWDSNYINEIEKIVNMLGKSGIYTLIDAHQDAGARLFCGEGIPGHYGEGVPTNCDHTPIGAFAQKAGICKSIKDFPISYDKDGYPIPSTCQKTDFGEYYTSPEVVTLFTRLYTNWQHPKMKTGMIDQFAKHWNLVAKKFVDNPYVVGYDLLNEPMIGGLYDDLAASISGENDKHMLMPMYQKLSKAIREVDNNKIIMFEGSLTRSVFADSVNNWIDSNLVKGHVGFTERPSSPETVLIPKEVSNIHSYCSHDIKDAEFCANTHRNNIKVGMEDADRLGKTG